MYALRETAPAAVIEQLKTYVHVFVRTAAICENICLQHKTPSTIHSKIKSAIEANLNLR